ncbi:MAG: hypothetical protein ACFBSE_17765 [Prochloraceae cyanobacterium]
MNEVIAEFRLYNIFTSDINISKSTEARNYYQAHSLDKSFNVRDKQGFVWYQDFVSFYTLSDYRAYWIKIAVKDRLEIDPIIANAKELRRIDATTAILLPFQAKSEQRIYVFGDDPGSVIFSFHLPTGHHQLLFQNRLFTKEEIQVKFNVDCQDLGYREWEDPLEFCLLTFIPTIEPIEPKILAYKNSFGTKEFSQPLILYDRKLYQNNDD